MGNTTGKAATSSEEATVAKRPVTKDDGARAIKQQLRVATENEFIQTQVHRIFLVGSGELGIANKIVGYLQDNHRLDSLKRIRQSNCTVEICKEFQKLIDADALDEAFAIVTLVAVDSLLKAESGAGGVARQFCSLVKAGGLDVLLVAVTKYPENAHFPVLVCGFMQWGYPEENLVESMEKETLYAFMVSDSCTKAMIQAVTMHRDNVGVAVCVAVYFMVATCMPWVYGELENDETKSSLLWIATELEAMPKLYSLLQKHKDKVIAVAVVSVFCMPAYRPMLKDLVVSTPDLDQTLMHQVEGLAPTSTLVELVTALRSLVQAIRSEMAA